MEKCKVLNVSTIAKAILDKSQDKSIREISRLSDISKSTIDDFFARKQKNYSASTIVKLHLYTGLAINELFNEKYIKAVDKINKTGYHISIENGKFKAEQKNYE